MVRVLFEYSKWQNAENNFNDALESLEDDGYKIRNVSLGIGPNDIVYALITYDEDKDES